MRIFHATPERPGPDHNAETKRVLDGFELRETTLTGKPYRYLEGLAVPFGVDADIGGYVEQHAEGSFAHSTRAGTGKSLPLLIAHDNRSLAAVAGHVVKWTNSADGLRGVWQLNDGPGAQTAAALADNGDVTGLSIGFQPIRSTWELLDVDDWAPELGPAHKDRVTRVESRLLEVSITPTPAFADAQVTAIRQRSRYTPEDRWLDRSEVDGWKRYVDEKRGVWA